MLDHNFDFWEFGHKDFFEKWSDEGSRLMKHLVRKAYVKAHHEL